MSTWRDRLTLIQDDITAQDTDCIVNAANEELRRGGGVCGAIHAAAGPELERACLAIGHCPTGGAVLTGAFELPCRAVIHAVGPIWSGGDRREDELLASCYRESLRIAAEHGHRSIAFPSISTGIYGFPIARASRVALAAIAETLAGLPEFTDVHLVCFSAEDLAVYSAVLDEMA